ncbi:MAG: hypothetical protein KY434_02085 [Actinobacteria bacterium]|nr:hypothetical protein [Actinomycetota bacterium]
MTPAPPRRPHPRDPWRRAPVGELQEQLLPRWFVLTALAMALLAAAVAVVALVSSGTTRLPVAARRPPPSDGLTSDVGRLRAGDSRPVVYAGTCPTLRGVRIAGGPVDRAVLRRGLAGLCNTELPPRVDDRLRRFAQAGGVVRFAQFEATGVDSAAALARRPPAVFVNAKFARTDPLWIAPLVAHDVTFLDADPASARGALAARRAELRVCHRLLAGRRPSRGCEDARRLLGLPDPLRRLRAEGFR